MIEMEDIKCEKERGNKKKTQCGEKACLLLREHASNRGNRSRKLENALFLGLRSFELGVRSEIAVVVATETEAKRCAGAMAVRKRRTDRHEIVHPIY